MASGIIRTCGPGRTLSSLERASSAARSRGKSPGAGARVHVLEATGIGAGATQASAGVLAPYIEAPGARPAARSDHSQPRDVRRLRRQILPARGGPSSTARCGTLEIAGDATAASRLRDEQALFPQALQWLDATRRHGRSSRRCTRHRRRAPRTGPRLRAGRGARQRPGRFDAGARRNAPRRRPCANIRRSDDGALDVHIPGGQSSPRVMSSWRREAGSARCRSPARRRRRCIPPVRGQLLRLRWPGDPLRAVLWGEGVTWSRGATGRCWSGRRWRRSASTSDPRPPGVRDLLSAVCELLPAAWGATFLEARAGLRPGLRRRAAVDRPVARRRGSGVRGRPLSQRHLAGAPDGDDRGGLHRARPDGSCAGNDASRPRVTSGWSRKLRTARTPGRQRPPGDLLRPHGTAPARADSRASPAARCSGRRRGRAAPG